MRYSFPFLAISDYIWDIGKKSACHNEDVKSLNTLWYIGNLHAESSFDMMTTTNIESHTSLT